MCINIVNIGVIVISVKNALIDPVTMTFGLLYHIISIGYPKVIPYNKFEHFGIIRF